MAEPDNLVLVLLRELRAELERQDQARQLLERRVESLRQALQGESVLGRYAAAEVEDPLAALRTRLDTLEKRA